MRVERRLPGGANVRSRMRPRCREMVGWPDPLAKAANWAAVACAYGANANDWADTLATIAAGICPQRQLRNEKPLAESLRISLIAFCSAVFATMRAPFSSRWMELAELAFAAK
jgi:hypothetical protein